MQKFEQDYADLITKIQKTGEVRHTRNGITKSMFGMNLTVPMNGDGTFPILQGRKMWPKGVFGELAAMLRKPKHIDDFKKWGCNYWGKWAKEDGSICVDYGNAWHAGNQINDLKDCLANNPTDRRMIISGWRPENLDYLDLPCCHLLYQFYVREGKYIDMMWYQRSVDMMIGLPSDIVFAAAWLIALANEFGYEPGNIKMNLGDCHIYDEHTQAACDYVYNVQDLPLSNPATYSYLAPPGKDFCEFEPADIKLSTYATHPKLELELKA
jgi:thymidylate synthase